MCHVLLQQSCACRVHMDVVRAGKEDEAEAPAELFSVFCKRIVLRELPYAVQKATTYPYKLARDVRANQNEAIFLQSALARAFHTAAGPSRIALPHFSALI